MNPITHPPARTPLGGIGCVGLLLLSLLVASLLGLVVDQLQGDSVRAIAPGRLATAVFNTPIADGQLKAGKPATATPTLPSATPTVAPPVIPSFTPIPSASFTATPTAMATETSAPTVTPTASLTPSPSPTATPDTVQMMPTPRDTITRTLRVPVLMYHYISTPPPGADKYRIDLSVEPAVFHRQMQYLAENGFTTIDLYDLTLALSGLRRLPDKPVILTFDDGYRDHYENAFPILQAFGLKGTFFVITEYVDRGHDAYLTWPMILEMAAAGHRLEPHTKTHGDLRGQSYDYVLYQMLGSRETLEARLGYRPRYFAYPGGSYDEQAIELLERLDFWGSVTTQGGKWHTLANRYEWQRLRVRHSTTLPDFADLVDPPRP